MDKTSAQRTVSQAFKAEFGQKCSRDLINELRNGFDESKKQAMQVSPPSDCCQRELPCVARFLS